MKVFHQPFIQQLKTMYNISIATLQHGLMCIDIYMYIHRYTSIKQFAGEKTTKTHHSDDSVKMPLALKQTTSP